MMTIGEFWHVAALVVAAALISFIAAGFLP